MSKNQTLSPFHRYMIDLGLSPIHISSAPNSDSSLMVLKIIQEKLVNGDKVIWLTREIPDSRKISNILGHVESSFLDKLVVIEFGVNLKEKIDEIKSILVNMHENDLLVIEQWCKNYGRTQKEDIDLMKKLVDNQDKYKIVITSNSYEDASGKKRGFMGMMSRGGKIIQEAFTTVWISKIENQYQKVLIFDGGKESVIEYTNNGYRVIN